MSNMYMTNKRLEAEEVIGKFRVDSQIQKVNAYMYWVHDGILNVYFGTANHSRCGHARFYWFNQDRICDGRVTVAQIEGNIFQDRLWLRERDDELAKKLFVKSYNEKAAALKCKLAKFEQNLLTIHTTELTKK